MAAGTFLLQSRILEISSDTAVEQPESGFIFADWDMGVMILEVEGQFHVQYFLCCGPVVPYVCLECKGIYEMKG